MRDALPLGLAGVMGLGILAFFALPFEPAFVASVLVFGFALLLAVLMFGRSRRARWLTLLPTTFVFGFTAAAFQTQRLGDHLLHEPAYTVAITGTVQNVIWRSDGPRFLLRNIQSDRPELDALRSVQIKWRGLSEGDAKGPALLGQTIEWTITLLPVRSAIVPGGFDFRRQAYFRGLSAYGYTLGEPVLISEPGVPVTEQWRQTLRARFLQGLKGDAGGLATALVVGLRGDLTQQAEAQIRAAGLAHILAISGLHVGMVAGALFFLVRLLGGLLPIFSLRLHSHRIAAVIAVLGALLYFSVSGGTVPTQRATIVVALAMLAILLARRPFSLRSVGFAALAVLVLQPSSLLTASFQMSFAAVIGLIVAFRFQEQRRSVTGKAPRRALNYVLSLSASSLIATAATGIFALYHFQQLSLLGVLANVVAVPLTALFIMPLLMLAAIITPLGLEGPILWLAQVGLDSLLILADFVSRLEDGVMTTRDWPPLSLFSAGVALWLGALLVRPLTMLALIPLSLSLVVAVNHRLPPVVADREEGILAANAQAPFLSFGARPGTVSIATASRFASEQLARTYNAQIVACDRETCALSPRVWISTSAQITAALCQTLPDAQIVTLAAVPRNTCTTGQAFGLRDMPRTGGLSFAQGPDGGIKRNESQQGRIQRFWTMKPTR